MARRYRFTCPECGYEAEVSGGADAGGLVGAWFTQTAVCVTCQRLWDTMSDSPDPRLRCRRGRSHRVRAWNHPGPCPKCGTTMDKGELTMILD